MRGLILITLMFLTATTGIPSEVLIDINNSFIHKPLNVALALKEADLAAAGQVKERLLSLKQHSDRRYAPMNSAEQRMVEEIERCWRSGRTIPREIAIRFPLPKQRLGMEDTGINVLLDHAHQVLFAMLWRYAGELRRMGFRVAGSQATLDTVLKPKSIGRVRIIVGDIKPFAWVPLPRFNVVITYQGNPDYPPYLPEERETLKGFVEGGGGLIILGARPRSEEEGERWSLNELAGIFGATFLSTDTRILPDDRRVAAIRLSPEWEVLERGRNGMAMAARRAFGKGHVMVVSDWNFIKADGETDYERVRDLIKWVASGKEPVGGEPRLPTEMAGGGGIYPELEINLGGAVVFYARNGHKHLLRAIREDLPKVRDKLYEWLPSPPPEHPMYIIASAGSGGGWACNYLPKETGVIANDPKGIISVFAHELAHTMCGPVNDKGVPAGFSPHVNQGEAHAGWFQGKAIAWYNPDLRDKSNRNCNHILEMERKMGRMLDLSKYFSDPEERKKWPRGAGWVKLWWIWQKLDDRYGTTWYPRWYWVRAMRWREEPDHRETWGEMVEDMSIAVGEDLFPFFRKIGTTLDRDRLERIEFMGKIMELPIAPIDISPAGPVRLEPAGDYTKPLKP